MSYDLGQFRQLIDETLAEFGLQSEAATALLLGTAAVESQFGTYLWQIGNGPAQGPFEIEPTTFFWLNDRYWRKYPILVGRKPRELAWDLRLGILVARLRYLVVPEPLPDVDDVHGLARYWKKYYNTEAGAGTVSGFVAAWRRYIGRIDAYSV